MLIKENPYGTNTLSLYVYFTTEELVSVSYTVSVEDESIDDFSQTPAGEDDFDTEHEFQVLGLIPEESNTLMCLMMKEIYLFWQQIQKVRVWKIRSSRLIRRQAKSTV